MTKSILPLLLLTFSLSDGFSQLSKTEYESVIEYFVDCIKNTNIKKLDSIISYPIGLPYPVPPINNKEDLKKRYSKIFDDSLTSLIVNSNIKEDWTDVGWRGIKLHNGIIWLYYDGRLLAINYSSKEAEEVEKQRIEYERELLNPDLKEFKIPIFTLETAKYIVRVDQLENQEYRYASWSKDSELSVKPDLIIEHGEWTADGSGGNHYFTFTNAKYCYVVYVNELATDDTSRFNLVVYKDEKEIINQPADLKQLK